MGTAIRHFQEINYSNKNKRQDFLKNYNHLKGSDRPMPNARYSKNRLEVLGFW
ncbi:hypothetical protein COO91_05283 [Nostoc flagelliforme CCNUN1]|uniref:Uncharacterized protein n=1 Tax=Nostoc flagelliforme CCNUN1 TaxID=2038116 RepID=A0A2K8SUZ8_9NOSO|nr:hypothetical protein COO91_05283 [Nostoc flagelliforme CCNUN1]